jgi:hypothetical protein
LTKKVPPALGFRQTVEYEVGYVPRRISLSRAMGLVWNCTDICRAVCLIRLQDIAQSRLHSFEQVIKRRYAACARAILDNLKNQKAAA